MTIPTDTATDQTGGQVGSDESSEPAASASTDGETDTSDQAAQAASTDEAAAPEVPEAYRAEDGSADLQKLIDRAAAADTVSEGVPESSDKYDLALPEDFKGADGEAYQLDPENEHLKASLDVLHKHGVPQEAISALLPAYVQAVQGDVAAMNTAAQEAVNAEIGKLGDKAEERMAGVKTGLTEIFGDETAATKMMDEIRSHEGFELFEQFITKINGGDEATRLTTVTSKTDNRSAAEILYPNQVRKA